MTLQQRTDYQRLLSRQFPLATQRVVYTKSGQHLAACRIEDPEAVIDHKLYWAPVDSAEEGRYLCAVLNSQALTDAVIGLQARGQHNPRDFDMHIFALPFPTYNPADDLHRALVDLSAAAEHVATTVKLDSAWQFQKARRVTREALREHGVAGQIDAGVSEMLAEALAGTHSAADALTA